MKKLFAAILSLVLVLSLCAPAMAYTIAGVNELPVVDEVVEYTILAPDVTYIEDLNENSSTQYVLDRTNVKINWKEIPDTEWKDKLNVLLAADQMPDAIMYGNPVFTSAELFNYGSQEMFLPLNDLIEQHGYYIPQVLDSIEGMREACTSMDGNIYTLPNVNVCYHCMYPTKAWINQTWLDNLGLEYPNTLDEFVAVLRAFKEQDANGNGDPNDEIPMGGCANSWEAKVYPFLLNSFLFFHDEKYLSVKDDKVIFAPAEPEFKQGIEFIKGLIDEGLIERESLTQTDEQFKVKGSNPDASAYGVVTGATYWIAFPAGVPGDVDLRSHDYVPLSPLEGPDGTRIAALQYKGYSIGHTVITTSCEDPVPLFKALDAMYADDARIRLNLGVEGEDYELPAEGALGINGKPALYRTIQHPEEWKNFAQLQNLWPSNRTADYRLGEVADFSNPDTQWEAEPRLYQATYNYYEPYGVDNYLEIPNMTLEESERYTFLKAQIDDFTKEQIVRFLASERSMDEWDAFQAEYQNNLNLGEYITLLQTAYDRQYAAK